MEPLHWASGDEERCDDDPITSTSDVVCVRIYTHPDRHWTFEFCRPSAAPRTVPVEQYRVRSRIQQRKVSLDGLKQPPAVVSQTASGESLYQMKSVHAVSRTASADSTHLDPTRQVLYDHLCRIAIATSGVVTRHPSHTAGIHIRQTSHLRHLWLSTV